MLKYKLSVKKVSVLIVLIVLAAVFGLFYWGRGNMAPAPKDKSTKIFVINPGEPVREIGNNLKKEGLIKDPVVFFIYLKLNRLDKSIQAGDYRLSPSMTLPRLIQELKTGTLDHWTTIPEGVRAEEIADIFEKDLPSYKTSWRAKLNTNEGYLFPDTYLVPKDADVDMVISMMKNNFNKKIESIGLSSDDADLERIITIASLIEREAKNPEDRPIVASVINNRLRIGMKLDIDATIQYALGYQTSEKRWWKKALSSADIELASPYNTYQTAGLPPTPISNPGIESIKAAVNPIKSDYLYYVNDKNGKIRPAKTIEEHNNNIQKYL